MSRRTLPPAIPANDLRPVSHADLLMRLRAHAASRRLSFPLTRPDGVRDPRHLTVGQEKRMISYLSRALTAAGIGPESTQCVRVLVPDLAARPTTRAIHADAPGAVRAALAVTFGYRATRRAQLPGGTGARFLPEQYRPLLAFVQPSDWFSKQPENLLTMVARAARAAGATTAPAEMPSANVLLDAAATLDGIGASRLGRALSAYRTLRARAVAANASAPFAPVPDGRIERRRGRGLLWTLSQRARGGDARAGEYLELVAAGNQRHALQVIFPGLHDDLETYLKSPRGERKKLHGGEHLRRTTRDVVDGVCRVAAAILDLGLASPGDEDVDLEWVWTCMRDVSAADAARNEKMRRRAQRKASADGSQALARTPISKLIADRLAEQSLALSASTGTGYPQTVAHDLWSAWAVAAAVYGDDLAATEPDVWLRMRTVWDVLRKQLRNRRSFISEDRQKQKTRGLACLPTPYVLAFGLPLLARHAKRLLGRAKQFIARAKQLNPQSAWDVDPDAVRAVDAFADAALRYLVTALATWDSLRSENYTYCLYGKHIRAVTLPSGTRVIHTAWSGDPKDRARVKSDKSRAWNLPANAIDLDVWDNYLSLVRAPRLLRRGVDADAAREPNGRFALFVTDAATDDPEAPLSETQISRVLFGGGLLWIARNLFGVKDLPERVELIDRKTWRGVFGVHFVRDLKATYLGTVMGEWAAAEEHTLDEVRTLRQHYAASIYGATFAAAGWDMSAWDDWSRCALLGSNREVHDALADPKLMALMPVAGASAMRRWRDEDREDSLRNRRSRSGTLSGRSRRRRPGQLPPNTRCDSKGN